METSWFAFVRLHTLPGEAHGQEFVVECMSREVAADELPRLCSRAAEIGPVLHSEVYEGPST
jgi:hypothetical protein